MPRSEATDCLNTLEYDQHPRESSHWTNHADCFPWRSVRVVHSWSMLCEAIPLLQKMNLHSKSRKSKQLSI